jgi:hypothetical protein
LSLFTKGRSSRLKQIKKALFKGKTVPQAGFVEAFEAMDPSVPKRHVSRIYVEAAKLSPAGGVNWKAFTAAAATCGLFEDSFQTSADEAQRKEEKSVKSLIKQAITDSWSGDGMERAVSHILTHLDTSGRPNDYASFVVLAELQTLFTQLLGSECPGFVLNGAFQKLVLAAFKSVVEISYPARHIYPATFDQVDTFKTEAKMLASFLSNTVKAAAEYNALR